jgi:hypothetical protein
MHVAKKNGMRYHKSEYTTFGGVDYGVMPTFAPTTYDVPKIPEENAPHHPLYSLWRYFSDGIPTSYVVVITSGAANASPGYATPSVDQLRNADTGSGEAGKAIFHGGQTYTVTAGEDTILTAAGYTVT